MNKEYIRGVRDTLLIEFIILIYSNLLVKALIIVGVYII